MSVMSGCREYKFHLVIIKLSLNNSKLISGYFGDLKFYLNMIVQGIF